MKHGIVLGKFSPLHKGHELLLEAAITHCDHLTVMIGDNTSDKYYNHNLTPSYNLRVAWITDFLSKWTNHSDKSVSFVLDIAVDNAMETGEDGTIMDSHFWSTWMATNSGILRTASIVFTSDPYGAVIAQRAGMEWFPVDPDRITHPVCATDIKRSPIGSFSSISDVAKSDVGLTVAIVGAESTGKTTIVNAIGPITGAATTPEWGRIITDHNPEPSKDDFLNIMSMQHMMIAHAKRNSFLAIADTEIITTMMFSKIYFGEAMPELVLAAKSSNVIDHYIVLAPNVDMVQDGTRVLDNDGRITFHNDLMANLEHLGKSFTVINDDVYFERQHRCSAIISGLME